MVSGRVLDRFFVCFALVFEESGCLGTGMRLRPLADPSLSVRACVGGGGNLVEGVTLSSSQISKAPHLLHSI